jgi:hypothetical protein
MHVKDAITVSWPVTQKLQTGKHLDNLPSHSETIDAGCPLLTACSDLKVFWQQNLHDVSKESCVSDVTSLNEPLEGSDFFFLSSGREQKMNVTKGEGHEWSALRTGR